MYKQFAGDVVKRVQCTPVHATTTKKIGDYRSEQSDTVIPKLARLLRLPKLVWPAGRLSVSLELGVGSCRENGTVGYADDSIRWIWQVCAVMT